MVNKALYSLAAGALVLSGCAMVQSTPEPTAPLDLKIVHMNDHHSRLTPDTGISLNLAGSPTRVAVGGFQYLTTKFHELTASDMPSVKIHAGDAITGDLYYTLFRGEADAALMNEVCFDVFALGNHEFDDGDAGLAKFLDFLGSSPDCSTDVVAANVKPKVGTSPLAMKSATDYFTPYTVKEFNGEKVGFIGIDIAQKTKGSSSPDETTQFLDEAKTAQKYIDRLHKKGINKIVLVTHYQYKNDVALAAQLKGVDVIIGGDSHTLLGNFTDLGLNTGGPYPTVVRDANGNLVCVAQAWQYGAVVGELNVSWDAAGNVQSCSGTPHLVLSDSFKRDGKELEGDARQAVYNFVEARPELSIMESDGFALATLSSFSGQVDVMKQAVIGTAAENLCLERVPGQGNSRLCPVSEIASRGSDITNIVAKAFRDMSITSDIAIQNGGGVRVDVNKGDITIGTAYTLLPFSNTIVELDMSGAELKAVLEEAFEYATMTGGSTGAYPYASGLRWKVDASRPLGERFYDLEVMKKSDTAWSPLNMDAMYKVATNDFISKGRDGYVTFGKVSAEGRVVDTYLDYAQSFVDYVMKVGTISKLPVDEYSTQVFINKDGVKQ